MGGLEIRVRCYSSDAKAFKRALCINLGRPKSFCKPQPSGIYNMSDIKYSPAPTEPPPSYDAVAEPKSNGTVAKPPPVRLPLPLDLPALNAIRNRRVILASASPRRKQLLAQVSYIELRTCCSPIIEPNKYLRR